MSKIRSYHTLFTALPDADGDNDTYKAPTEFKLFSYGKTDTLKGAYHFDKDSADACMKAACDYGNRLTIDYEHQSLSDPPIKAPAAGSFVAEMRADGLWAADVKWTPVAEQHLKNKEYLFTSPAFLSDKEGRPNRIINVALTNIPATKHMDQLVAASANFEEQPKMKTVLKALSLKDDCGEAEMLSAVTAMTDERKKICALTGQDSVGDSLAIVSAWKIAAGEVEQLRADVAKRNAEQAAKDFDAEIASAKASALLSMADTHKRNVAALSYRGEENALKGLRKFLSGLDPLVAVAGAAPVAAEPPVGQAPVIALSDEEKKLARQMGVKPEAYLKTKEKHMKLIAEGYVLGQDDKGAA